MFGTFNSIHVYKKCDTASVGRAHNSDNVRLVPESTTTLRSLNLVIGKDLSIH